MVKLATVRASIYSKPKPSVPLLPTGSTLFDCALSGGYPIGRIVNIIGDRATAKTLCAIEACANFAKRYPNGTIHYVETESAFDQSYAEDLGMPLDRVNFVDNIATVEEFFDTLTKIIKEHPKDEPGLVILDSYDALSDYAETQRGISDGSFGATKAKKSSELFRRLAQQIEHNQILLIIISQIRDNIGAVFGKKYTRSGGRALDFYASQIIYLAHIKTLKRTVNKVSRAIGILIKIKVEKNKIGPPFREVEFEVRFGYGIEDMISCVKFLEQTGHLRDIPYFAAIRDVGRSLNKLDSLSDQEYRDLQKQVRIATRKSWQEIEDSFRPVRKKY